MNKYMTFGIIIMFVILITYVADITATYNVVGGGAITADPNGEITTIEAFGLLRTWWQLVSFQITGFPPFLNLIVFYPLNLVALFMGLDIVKDLIPFT